ncbi:helix-turn-helix domain-containing protein [Aeromicrobium alkaliterrae]|uniref:HTH tetR-type domain-containing protein n=1 Tax=Aeromicrobium alkaliterrae TaxID=302168 RepID=A0ABN2K049_9ACTN
MSPERDGVVDPASTGQRLLDAAEELFALHGSESVSLRQISRHAGAGNVLAVQYWFSDRDGLVRAVLDRHHDAIDDQRHALIDGIDPTLGSEDRVRALSRALVVPWAAELETGARGAGYLRLVSDLLHRPEPSIEPWRADDPDSSMVRWRDALDEVLDPQVVALHRRFRVARFVISELSHRAVARSRTQDPLFVSQLVDIVAGMLQAPVSAETAALVERQAD